MSFKAFVSENQLEENRKVRQAEWEKVRKPEDPEEAPEPEYDPRSLFDRLQEQKIKKQEEFDESRRLKNLICVLDQDETSFLEMVDQKKIEEEMAKAREEKAALEEFRKAIEGLTKDEQESKINEFKKSFSVKVATRKSIKRTLNGSVANLIKIKPDLLDEKKDTPSTSNSDQIENKRKDHPESSEKPKPNSVCEVPKLRTTPRTCLVDYGSDSEDDSDSRESVGDTSDHPNKKLKSNE